MQIKSENNQLPDAENNVSAKKEKLQLEVEPAVVRWESYCTSSVSPSFSPPVMLSSRLSGSARWNKTRRQYRKPSGRRGGKLRGPGLSSQGPLWWSNSCLFFPSQWTWLELLRGNLRSFLGSRRARLGRPGVTCERIETGEGSHRATCPAGGEEERLKECCNRCGITLLGGDQGRV